MANNQQIAEELSQTYTPSQLRKFANIIEDAKLSKNLSNMPKATIQELKKEYQSLCKGETIEVKRTINFNMIINVSWEDDNYSSNQIKVVKFEKPSDERFVREFVEYCDGYDRYSDSNEIAKKSITKMNAKIKSFLKRFRDTAKKYEVDEQQLWELIGGN